MLLPKSVVNGTMGTLSLGEMIAIMTHYCCSDYEGLLTAEIREKDDKWDIWRDGCI
jgi:hypothetical protein